MITVKVKKKITSSILKIRELEKFKNQNVEILIKPIKKIDKNNIKIRDLLNISVWKIEENDLKIKPWLVKEF